MDIIKSSWRMDSPVRLLSITGINLCDEDEEVQLSMFDTKKETDEKAGRIDAAVDKIREKYGKKAITFGSIINNDIGISLDKNKTED